MSKEHPNLEIDTAEALARRIEELEVLLAARDERVSALSLASDGTKVAIPKIDIPLLDDVKAAELQKVVIEQARRRLVGNGVEIPVAPNVTFSKDYAFVEAWVRVPLEKTNTEK